MLIKEQLGWLTSDGKNGVYINKGTTKAWIPVKQFVDVMNKYSKVKFLLDKDQLRQLNNEEYVWVGVDQLIKIKKIIESANGQVGSEVRKNESEI